jgi:hypothetical protein
MGMHVSALIILMMLWFVASPVYTLLMITLVSISQSETIKPTPIKQTELNRSTV